MTMRRVTGWLAAAGLLGCGTNEAPAPATRAILVPGPYVLGHQFSKDGRLAFSKLVDGKAAIYVADADGRNARRVSFGVWDSKPMWSPDGKSIALVRDAGGQNDVFIVPADSGEELSVAATPPTETPNAWLPDGSGLLFTRYTASGNATWVYRLADGSTTKAIDADGSVIAFPSPDGKWLAYTLSKDGKHTIWLWDRDKKTRRQLTTEGFEGVSFWSFSPDSRSLLYYSGRTGTGDLWRLDVATGVQRQLTQDIAEDGSGKWSPDGTRILFTSNRGGQADLWILTTGESDVQRVTDDAVAELDAQWAPDGRAVIATVERGLAHVYAVPLTGAPPTALTVGEWSVTDADVSPDGKQVAYSGTKNGDEDIWVVPVAGGASTLVSGGSGFDGEVRWAPDGERLAFTSWRSGSADIWIAALGGGKAVRLTDWKSTEWAARWSPDGKTIAFLSNHESSGSDLWTMPAAGGAPTRITRIGSARDHRWSPDGKTFAFSAEIAGKGAAVFLVSAAGGTVTQLSSPTSRFPEWRSDGREISMMQCSAGYCSVDIWSTEGKRLRTLTQAKDLYEWGFLWSSNGSHGLLTWQQIRLDAANVVDLRSSVDGSTTMTLARPAGYTMNAVGFADAERRAILIGWLTGTSLQRIDIPAP